VPVAIVQQQNSTRSQARNSLLVTRSTSPIPGVEARAVPAGKPQPSRGEHRVEKRIAQAGWRAKKQGTLAGNRSERVLGGLQLTREAGTSHQREIMAVMLDCGFPRHGRAARFRGTSPGSARLFPDAEEGGLGSVTIQNFQYLRGDDGIGTVVNGQAISFLAQRQREAASSSAPASGCAAHSPTSMSRR